MSTEHAASHDWWVLGCDPIQSHLLVRCRLTHLTGVVKDAKPDELLAASAKNFSSYPWIQPERVEIVPLKPHVVKLARKSQKLSTYIGNTQSLASRLIE